MRRITRRLRDESGMTYVFVGLGFMAFLGASMLAIDVGMLMTARNQAQNSADAAALAGATAEASPANAMTCVKPFTIPDKWTENQTAPWDPTDGFSRYDKKGNVIPNADVYVPAFNGSGQANAGYTGYNNEANRGVRLVLRSGQGTQIQSSFYFSLAMIGDTGGDDYRWNIGNCNHSIYHWGDALTQEPGDKEGPTIQGVLELIARDPKIG